MLTIRTRLRLIRYWLRHQVPWTTRLEYRDMANHRAERLRRLEDEYTVAREGITVAMKQRDSAEQRLVATEAGLRKFLEGMQRAAEVETAAMVKLLESLPDHTPQDRERRQVVDGLRHEAMDGAHEVHFSVGRPSNGNGRPVALGPDRILVIPPDAPKGEIIASYQESADADIILDLRDEPRVVKNRYGPEHNNVFIAGG